MGVFFGSTEITGMHFGEQEITEIFFGNTEIFSVWATYDGTLPAQYSANGSMLADYRIYGSAGGVGDRTENYLQVTPDMYIANNWESVQFGPTDPTKYFMYFELPQATKDILAHLEEVYANAYLIGTHYNFLVFAITDNKYSSVETKYRVIQNDGGILPWVKDVSNWEHIYLCIGYGQGITTNNKQTLINAFFDNYNLSLTEGSTAPAEHVPYGYEVDMGISDSSVKQLFNEIYPHIDATARYMALYVGEGSFTLSTNTPLTSQQAANLFLLAGNVTTGASTPTNGVYNGRSWSVTAINGYITIAYRAYDGVDPRNYRVMLNTGSTPLPYQPYSNTTVPIYIGSDPLGEDEYVDYGEGKIYRMSGGVLTPTDPPVPLPALPTVDGTNIVDYAGQSAAPSRFYAKYRKEGF